MCGIKQHLYLPETSILQDYVCYCAREEAGEGNRGFFFMWQESMCVGSGTVAIFLDYIPTVLVGCAYLLIDI